MVRHLGQAWAAYGVLLVAVALTLLATTYVYQNVESRERVRFEETVEASRAAVDRRVTAYTDVMVGAGGLIFASDEVSREEWTGYTRAIDLESRYGGLQALGYAPYVPPGGGEAFARRMREEGNPEAASRLGRRDAEDGYYPLSYVEPATAANRAMLGRDLYADPEYREVMNAARDTGSAQATEKTYLISDPPPDSSADFTLKEGFMVFVPIYGQDQMSGPPEGYVVGAVRTDEMIREIFGEPLDPRLDPSLDLEIYDKPEIVKENLVYSTDGVQRASQIPMADRGGVFGALVRSFGLSRSAAKAPEFSRSVPLYINGKEWTLYQGALPGFRRNDGRLPLFVLLSGLGVSLLLFGITSMLVGSRVRAVEAGRKLENANRELEATNSELETFSYSVSHDLRAPLRSIDGFSQILLEDYADELDEEGKSHLGRVRAASQRMGRLIDDLLGLSRVTRGTLRREKVDLSSLAREVARSMMEADRGREVEFLVEDNLEVWGDARLIRVALENLFGNALKFTGKNPDARIEFGVDSGLTLRGRVPVYYVRDNGAGFDMAYAGKLFGAFQRLHTQSEFDGTGIGLATVQRIVHRHGGRIWAEGEVGEGAAFYFTLTPGLKGDPGSLRAEMGRVGGEARGADNAKARV